jgi:hypothetical protein
VQLLIAAIGLLTALVPLVASIVQLLVSMRPATGKNDKPRSRTGAAPPSRKRAAWLFGIAIGIAALTLMTAYVVVPRFSADKPLAEIGSPLTGDRINRPAAVDVRLNGRMPDGGSVWLGYQNEEGGPFIVQAARCAQIGNRLDCGPLYVGHDDEDPAEFRVFVLTADALATARLTAGGTAGSAEPGDNFSLKSLPEGSRNVAEARRVRLRDSS